MIIREPSRNRIDLVYTAKSKAQHHMFTLFNLGWRLPRTIKQVVDAKSDDFRCKEKATLSRFFFLIIQLSPWCAVP